MMNRFAILDCRATRAYRAMGDMNNSTHELSTADILTVADN